MDLSGVVIRGAEVIDVDISGWVENLRVNGVDVVPLVEAELDRRYPDRVKMRPTDADGFREGWAILETLWQGTVERARGMAPELLHERVEGEWSFIETLRHLVFATDAWVRRAFLGEPSPWDPLDLPHDEMPDIPAVPRDLEARPSLEEVLALRADRMATVRQVLADLTDERLAGMTEPVTEPGYPEPESFPSGGACRRSSTRSGSTGCTPSATSTCSRRDPPDRGRCVVASPCDRPPAVSRRRPPRRRACPAARQQPADRPGRGGAAADLSAARPDRRHRAERRPGGVEPARVVVLARGAGSRRWRATR